MHRPLRCKQRGSSSNGPQEPTIDLTTFDGSQPPEAGAPAILILGSAHVAQVDHEYADDSFQRVAEALAEFEPDLVAVEHLPPDWPPGAGRDYRPDFDLDVYADRWSLSGARTEALIKGRGAQANPCEVGRAYFLRRDLANAAYWWDTHECPELRGDEAVAGWWARRSEHEDARMAHPVARASGVDALVSIDYQGEDARWFIHEEALTLDALTSPGDLWAMLPDVNPRARQLRAHTDANDGSLVELLTHLNSPQRIALQYWAYEQALPDIEARDAGARQRSNFWVRNEQMFGTLDEAVRAAQAERVLVITGAGHKYFLDRLAHEAGYRWIDPRDYLPEAADLSIHGDP